jgi:hypothetical protein
LARCQLGDCLEGNPTGCQLATNSLKLRLVGHLKVKHCFSYNYRGYVSASNYGIR